MLPSIPESIQPLLNDYLSLMDERLPGFITGFYLYGSVALNAFEPQQSDIDFVSVADYSPTTDEIKVLSEIHRCLAEKYPKPPLEGVYLQGGHLGKPKSEIPSFPYYHEGKLETGHFEINPVTWWTLQYHRVVIRGEQPDLNVDLDELLGWMKQNLNSYWRRWASLPYLPAYLSDWTIQWVVLGGLRQVYTFREKSITSKSGAGEYALEHFPVRWHRIIQEALNIRARKSDSLYRFKLLRALDAYRFLVDILKRYG